MAIVIKTPVRPPRSRYDFGSTATEASVLVAVTGGYDFLNAVLGEPKRFHYLSRNISHIVDMPDEIGDERHNEAAYDVATVSLGLQATHQAFAGHVPLSLRPDTLWYFIVHEVAQYVRYHADRYAALFTSTLGLKQTILVRDDSVCYDMPSDWQRSINLVRDPLAAKLTDRTMALFLPRFSTSTIEDETALLVALMDVVSPYYKFEWMTRCGIPQVRLEGDASDWRLLHDQTEGLARIFDGLHDYFVDLLPVLRTIAETAAGIQPDDTFWRSLYKYDAESDGTYVTGWITAFFAYLPTGNGPQLKPKFDWRKQMSGRGGYTTNQFPSHVSRVRFIWDYFGRQIDMAFAAGVTTVDFDDTFLSPRLGFAVVEN